MPTETRLDNLVINSVDSYDTYKKMEEQNLINENEIYLVDGDNSQEKITAEGILKGDGQGNVTAAETVEAEVVDIPVGILKGTADGLEAAVVGADYAAASHTHGADDVSGVMKYDQDTSDCNTSVVPGNYRCTQDALNVPDEVYGYDGNILFVIRGDSNTVCQLLTCSFLSRHYLRISSYNGEVNWGDWQKIEVSNTDEYSNPLMLLGTEYLTTQKWKGQSVYKKLDTDGVIKWRIDGETEWKPEVVYTGAEAVVTASAPLTNVTLETSELAAWLNALPRLVTKNYVLHVKAGTVAQTLNLSNFYGPGRIRILNDTAAGAVVTLSKGVSAYYTKLQIAMEGFTITGTAESEATVFCYATDCLCLYNCTLAGNGVKYGVYNQACAQTWLNGGSISGYQVAVDAIGLARIGLESVACSDNTRGATVWGCGEVMLSGSTPNTLGGSANSKSGGIITAANGTLL